MPNLRGAVFRHLEVSVSGYDRDGVHRSFEVRGYSAGTFQHENDHLDGILFPHRVADSSTFCSWSSFSAFRQEAFAEPGPGARGPLGGVTTARAAGHS